MDETGGSSLEYSLLLVLIALVILAAVTNVGQTGSNMFVNCATTISTSKEGAVPPGIKGNKPWSRM
jgi:Flp pilus assembly pilin Flp